MRVGAGGSRASIRKALAMGGLKEYRGHALTRLTCQSVSKGLKCERHLLLSSSASFATLRSSFRFPSASFAFLASAASRRLRSDLYWRVRDELVRAGMSREG
jgi:hypothetical protein